MDPMVESSVRSLFPFRATESGQVGGARKVDSLGSEPLVHARTRCCCAQGRHLAGLRRGRGIEEGCVDWDVGGRLYFGRVWVGGSLMASQRTFAWVSRVVSRLYGRLFSSNPYPLYKFLRRRYPLLRTPIGFWISTRYDNCVSILRDKRFAAFDLNALDAFPPDDGLKSMREALQHAIVFRNPPDHTRLRKLMNTFFSPAVVAGLEPTIQRIFDDLLDKVQERGSTASGSLDLISDLAFPFPIDVLAEVMGATDADKPIFRDWMRTLGVPLDPVISANDPGVEVRAAIDAVRRYFSDLAADRRIHPRAALIRIIVAAEER